MCEFTFQGITGGSRMGSEGQKSHIRASWKERFKDLICTTQKNDTDNWQQTTLLCEDAAVTWHSEWTHTSSLCYRSSFFLPHFDCWAGSLCVLGLLTVWINVSVFSDLGRRIKKYLSLISLYKLEMKNPHDRKSLENSSIFIAKYFCTEYNWKKHQQKRNGQ